MPRRRPPPRPQIVNPLDAFREEIVVPPPIVQPQDGWTERDAQELQARLAKLAHRRSEALNLYEPLPLAVPFHKSNKRIRLVIGGNRSSKTTSAAVEVSRAVTGQDPENKYPKENGLWFIFASSETNIGTVIYEKLFRPGAFKIIRDLQTKRWRAYRPMQDIGRERESRPAPPLIPQRFIKTVSWKNKKARVPEMVVFKNGWEIRFFSAQGDIPTGQAINGWWIDEEPKREGIVEELRSRSVDRRGVGIWSATPQAASVQLLDLHDQAGDGDIEEFHLHILDNPHIPQEEKDALYRGMSEEVRKVRWDGKFLISSRAVYPEFSTVIHAWPEPNWQPPARWSLYASVDPGRQICGTLFLAVPPREIGQFAVIYDELYLKQCTADMFGRAAAAKTGQRVLEAFLIDGHMGRVNEMGSGLNIEEQYRNALVRHGLQMRNVVGFTWGNDDLQAGISTVHSWLQIASNGKPRLYVVTERCPQLVREFSRYLYTVDKDDVPTDKPVKKNDHLMDTLRYLCCYDPKWREPKVYKKTKDSAYEAFQRKKARQKSGSTSGGVTLGM